MLISTILLSLFLSNWVLCMPPNDKAIFDPENPEARIRKKGGPCRGRSPQGRTFFDWSFQHINVDYNYNYNINCGGGGSQHGGGGGVDKPILSAILQGGNGGGGGSNKPILSGILQGISNRPEGSGSILDGPITFVQSQVQGIFANGQGLGSIFNGEGIGSWLPQGGIGSWLPQGGLFNGQGITSLFENGLFSNIFDRPQTSGPQTPIPPTTPSYQVTTTNPEGGDPDDIIYNDEKPVHVDHDPVVPDQYNRPAPRYQYRPRQYQYQNSRSNRIKFV